MNTDVLIFGFILLVLSIAFLWSKLIHIEKQIKEIENWIDNSELDDFLKRAFQTDSQRLDLLIKRKMEAVVDKKLQEHKEKMKKILEG